VAEPSDVEPSTDRPDLLSGRLAELRNDPLGSYT
jgi:hypothetical protein